jgi:phosphoribosylformylglycinamidine (FGAM) synthase-like enzyme
VSFYNQTVGADGTAKPVYPTPTIGMLGLIDNADRQMTLDFKEKGELIFMLGESRNDLGCSEYLSSVHGVRYSPAPHFDLDFEVKLHKATRNLIDRRLIACAHDVSDGGVFTALVEMGSPRSLGFDVESDSEVRLDAFLFGEAQGRILVTTTEADQEDFLDLLAETGIPVTLLGHTTKGKCVVDGKPFGFISEYEGAMETAIPNAMAQ